MTIWIVLAVIVVAVLYGVTLYNGLVRKRNLVHEGWSGIDVQLKRRADLIPNLVETVKGYAAHEKAIFEDVADKRAASMQAGDVKSQAAADQALSGALGRLIAISEAYPELKADANFRELQGQLAEIEDQMQMARRYYNGTVRDLNIAVQSFPAVLVAGPLGFHAEPFYEIEDRASASIPPKVSF
ncbi:LemA protein [Kaistia dalseonensis]|uniref:LemA protein n=1 Tax=Kaistia dalseonensis TaxID=410840 RepID=A0ABU0H6D5_9HYPH|nr:LemA protein [Kaistia dalseonensis]